MSSVTLESSPQKIAEHSADAVIKLFNQTFLHSENTELVRGNDEPIYLPASENHPHHRIVFAHGFFASALHEIAHWCVAGKQRRLLEDFGYWYEPDGRSVERQAEFERVEVKPQALEWIFSVSAGYQFHFSADNLALGNQPSESFKHAVLAQVQNYLTHGMPKNAQQWSQALLQHYQKDNSLSIGNFQL